MTNFDDELATAIRARLAEMRTGLATSVVAVGGDPGRVVRAQLAADQAVDLAPAGDGWTATPVQLSPGGALTIVGRPAVPLVVPPAASARDVADAFGAVVDVRRRELTAPPAPSAAFGARPGFSAPSASFGPGFAPAFGSPLPQASTRPALTSRAWTLLVIGTVVVGLLVLAAGGLGVLVAAKAVSTAGERGSSSQSGTGMGSGSGTSSGSGTGSGSSGSAAGTDPAVKLTVGQCFDVGDAYDLGDDVAVKSCTTSHDSEVFATVTVNDAASQDDRVVYDEADAACYGDYAAYVGDSYDDSDLDYAVLAPSDEQITAGSTTAVCYVVLHDPKSSSVKGSGD